MRKCDAPQHEILRYGDFISNTLQKENLASPPISEQNWGGGVYLSDLTNDVP